MKFIINNYAKLDMRIKKIVASLVIGLLLVISAFTSSTVSISAQMPDLRPRPLIGESGPVPGIPQLQQANTQVSVQPEISDVENIGDSFTVTVSIADVNDLGSFEFELHYDPNIVMVDSVVLGSFLGSTGRTIIPVVETIDNVTGKVAYSIASFGMNAGPSGDGVLGTINLTSRAQGSTALDLQAVQVGDTNGNTITTTVVDGVANIALPILVISKIAQPDPVVVSSRLTYTLMISNLNSIYSATNVIITDTLPAQTAFASADQGGVLTGTQVQWMGHTIAEGSALTVSFVVTVNHPFIGTELTNAVYGAFANDQKVAASGATTITTQVIQPELAISKTAALATVTSGSPLTYTLTISNLSNLAAATGVIITDTLPAQTTFVSADQGGSLSGNQVLWTTQTLAPNQVLTRQFVVLVDQPFNGSHLLNDAYGVSSSQGASSIGSPVSTEVTVAESKVYLPLVLKKWIK